MYETYRDTCYLEKFIEHADSVLKQRDSERGVTDYRGLSLPPGAAQMNPAPPTRAFWAGGILTLLWRQPALPTLSPGLPR